MTLIFDQLTKNCTAACLLSKYFYKLWTFYTFLSYLHVSEIVVHCDLQFAQIASPVASPMKKKVLLKKYELNFLRSSVVSYESK